MAGQFEWNNIKFEFDRFWNDYEIGRNNIQSTSESASGIEETLEYFNRDRIRVVRNRLTPAEILQLEEWYEYVRDGSSFKLWMDKDIVFYSNFDGKKLTTVDGEDETFTRATTAQVVDPHTGLLTTVAINTPKFKGGKFGDAVLLEDAVGNLLDDTENMLGAAWNSTNMTLSSNQMLFADGNKTLDKLTATANSATLYQQPGDAIITYNFTFSIWAQTLIETKTFRIQLYVAGGAQLASLDVTATPTLQRFSVTYSNALPGGNIEARITLISNGDIIYVGGAQLEKSDYMSSYVKDAGTMSSDGLYYSVPSWLDSQQYSVSCWVYPYFNVGVGNSKLHYIFILYDSVNSHVCSYLGKTTLNNYALVSRSYDGGTDIYSANNAGAFALTQRNWHYIVGVFDNNSADGINMYIDGSLITFPYATTDNLPGMSGIPDRLYLGCHYSLSNLFTGYIDDFLIENRVLTASEILNRYNASRAVGIRRNYYSEVKLVNPSFNPIMKMGGKRWDFEAEFKEVLS